MSVEEPVDGEVIEYWVVKVDGSRPHIDHLRSTFHANTSWSDHPWSAQHGPHGVGFVNEWSTDCWHPSVQRWGSGGRGSVPWMQKRFAEANVFTDESAARAHAIQWCLDRMDYLTGQVVDLRMQVDRFEAGSLR